MLIYHLAEKNQTLQFFSTKTTNMSIVTWLLTRVVEDAEEGVGINHLYDAYQFEAVESGETAESKRVFADHILKVYPSAQKKRITRKKSTTVTLYNGIRILPIDTEHRSEQVCLENVQQMINRDSDFEVLGLAQDHLKCRYNTGMSANGNNVEKEIRLFDNGQWTLTVSGKTVDLAEIQISNRYVPDERGVRCVLNATRRVQLCEGVKVQKNIVMTRFHTVENLRTNICTKRILRSKLCNRVCSFNAQCTYCVKCQKMTMYTETNNTEISNKENIQNDVDTPSGLKKNTISISKSEILHIIPGATDEMVELFQSQAKNASRDPKGRRWTQGMIRVCLQWFCRSPQSYEQFRATNFLVLPGRTTLIQYKNKVKQNVGFDNCMFEWMLEEAKKRNLPDEGYTGGIIIDEMAIQSDIQICRNGDLIELAGFLDVGEEGNSNTTMRKGKNAKVLGTHAVQFVFLGINGFRFPFAHFISDGIQAPDLYPLFWEAVDRLRMFGFQTVYTCMDGAQSNRSFLHINTNAEQQFKSVSPCSFGHMVFIMDVKHVIKKIRNNVLKSGILKTSTRLLTLTNGTTVQWQMFIDCYNWDKTNGLQLHRKLTNDHLFPSNQMKMRNHLAEDVLDSDMLHVLLQYQQSLGAKGEVLDGAVEFLRQTSKLIQIFEDMRPIKNLDDQRIGEVLSVAKWFDTWKKDTSNDKSTPPKDRQKKLMSLQCHEDIQSCLIGFCQLCYIVLEKASSVYVTPGLINSDVIENTFNQQRSTYHGANSNPTALQYRYGLNSILLGQQTVSQKANAGKNRSAAAPYNCTLRQPVSVKKRKLDSAKDYTKIKVLRM